MLASKEIKYFVLIFRFLAYILGILLTNFGRDLINIPPSSLNWPAIIVLIFLIYHIIASFVMIKFIQEKFVLFFLIVADMATGAFLVYLYGTPFFLSACIFPFIEALIFLGFFSVVVGIVSVLIYFPILGSEWETLKKRGALKLFSAELEIYLGITILIVVLLFMYFKQHKKISTLDTEHTKEKIRLLDDIKETKNQAADLCNELGKRQDSIQRLHFELQKKVQQLRETQSQAQDIRYQGQELLQIAQDKEERTIQSLQKLTSKLKLRTEYLEERVSSLTQLIKIFEKFSLSAHIEETYLNVVKMAQEILSVQTCVLFIADTVDDQLQFSPRVAATPYEDYFHNLSFLAGEGVIGYVAQTRKPLIISKGSTVCDEKEFVSLVVYEKSALILPLVYQEDIFGVIYLGQPKVEAFSSDDLEKLNIFSKLVSIGLKFIKDYQAKVSKSLKDSATGLYTNFYFYERLKDEFIRSKRYKFPLSLLIINIDKFEDLFKKYGHQTAKNILKETAKLIVNHSRETDIVAYLDEKSFQVLLTQTDRKEAILIAERIRMAVGVRLFDVTPEEKINISLSIGISVFPEKSSTAEKLLEDTKEALELARSKGGNITCFKG